MYLDRDTYNQMQAQDFAKQNLDAFHGAVDQAVAPVREQQAQDFGSGALAAFRQAAQGAASRASSQGDAAEQFASEQLGSFRQAVGSLLGKAGEAAAQAPGAYGNAVGSTLAGLGQAVEGTLQAPARLAAGENPRQVWNESLAGTLYPLVPDRQMLAGETARIKASLTPSQMDEWRQQWLHSGNPNAPFPWESEQRTPTDDELANYLARHNAMVQGAVGGVMMLAGNGLGGEKMPLEGAPTRAFGVTDPNAAYGMTPRAVPLDELVPSHTDALAENPAFPQELQPRDRDRLASQAQIQGIAQNLSPDALLVDSGQLDRGTPIIGPGNLVLSGNGRTLALRLARQSYPENWQTYQERLAQVAPAYGIDPAALAGIKDPVLVRQLEGSVDLPAFVSEANARATMAMSPAEQAAQDATRLQDSAVARLEVGENQTIDQALTSAANRDFVRSYAASLPENERAAVQTSDGALNAAGLQRLKDALLARTYPGDAGRTLAETFTESIDPGVKNVEAAVYQSLPDMARAEALTRAGLRDPSLSIAEDLAGAVNVLGRLRQQGIRVDDYLAQSSMLDRELSPTGERILGQLAAMGSSPRRLRLFLKDYARAVEAQPDPRQAGMFGERQLTREELLDRVIKQAGDTGALGPLFTTQAETPAAPPVGQELAAGARAPNESQTPAVVPEAPTAPRPIPADVPPEAVAAAYSPDEIRAAIDAEDDLGRVADLTTALEIAEGRAPAAPARGGANGQGTIAPSAPPRAPQAQVGLPGPGEPATQGSIPALGAPPREPPRAGRSSGTPPQPPYQLPLPPRNGPTPPGGPLVDRARNSPNSTIAGTAKTYESPITPKRRDGLWTATVRAMADRGVDLKRLQDAAVKAGVHLGPQDMAYYLARLNPTGRAAVEVQRFLRPAWQEVGRDTDWLSQAVTYQQEIDRIHAVAQAVYDRVIDAGRTPEQASAAQQKALNTFKLPGGRTYQETVQALADIPNQIGPERWAKVQAAAQASQGFARYLWDRKLQAGLISQKFHDDMVRLYPHWVPTKILEYMGEPDRALPGVSKLSVNDPLVRRYTLTGSDLTREDPLASLVRYAYETERVAGRNEAVAGLVNLVDKLHGAGQDTGIRMVQNSYKAKTGLGEATVTLFRDGEMQKWLMPADMAAVVERKPLGGTIMDTPMALFRAATTGRNPLFVPWNAARDISTYVMTQATASGGISHLPEVITELFRGYGDAFRGLATGSYHGATADMLQAGGQVIGRYSGSTAESMEHVGNLTKGNFLTIRNADEAKSFIKRLLTLEPVESFGNRVELAPRTAAFRLAKKQPLSDTEAAIRSREATVDFEMGGNLARVINQYVPFFNVGMQGLLIAPRTARANPRAFASVVPLIAGPAVVAEAWNRSDPQRAKDYEDVPDFIKQQGTVVMLPRNIVPPQVDAQGNGHPQFVLFPLRDFLPLALVAQEAVRVAMGQARPDDWAKLLNDAWAGISPTQVGSVISLLPPGIQQAVELSPGVNRDFFTNRMVATNRNDARATALAQAIAYGLNSISGAVNGQEVARPSQVDFALQSLGGGPGKMAMGASEVLAPRDVTTAGTLQGTPIIGGLAGRWIRGSTGQRLQDLRAATLSDQSKAILKAGGVNVTLAPAANAIGTITLTTKEEETYQAATNDYVNRLIGALARTPAWQSASPYVRQKLVEKVVAMARQAARAATLRSIPRADLAARTQRVAAERAAEVRGATNAGVR